MKKKPGKPHVIKQSARHEELTAKLKEAEAQAQARKAAESCVALEKAGDKKKGGCG